MATALSELAPGLRVDVFSDSFDFGLEGQYTLGIYMSQGKTHLGSPKAELVRIHHYPVIILPSENLFQMLQVLLFIFAGDTNVVSIGTAEGETAQDTIEKAVEDLGGQCVIRMALGVI